MRLTPRTVRNRTGGACSIDSSGFRDRGARHVYGSYKHREIVNGGAQSRGQSETPPAGPKAPASPRELLTNPTQRLHRCSPTWPSLTTHCDCPQAARRAAGAKARMNWSLRRGQNRAARRAPRLRTPNDFAHYRGGSPGCCELFIAHSLVQVSLNITIPSSLSSFVKQVRPGDL